MTATFRDSNSVVTGVNPTNITVPVPAGTVDGDLLIAFINFGDNPIDSAPANWTHIPDSPHNDPGNGESLRNNLTIMTKIAGVPVPEPASYQWDRSGAEFTPIGGVMVAFEDAVIESSTLTGERDSHPIGMSSLYAREDEEGPSPASVYLTCVAITGEWWSGGSAILPSTDFTELEDVNFNGNGGHTQVQMSTVVDTEEEELEFDVNLSAGVPTSTHSWAFIGLESGPPEFLTLEVINVDPSSPDAIPLNSPISFDLVGPANFLSVGVSVKYRSNSNRFMVYETDGFTEPYAPGSTITGAGTDEINFSLFEFKGWRDRVDSITVFGVNEDGTLFSIEVLG